MYFCIDYDTRQVESKSDSKTELEKYISENDLEMAVALVDSADELCLQFSIDEMRDVYGFLNENPPNFKSEEEASESVWETLEEHEDEFPYFTAKLGKKLLSEPKVKEKSETKPTSTKTKSAPKQSSGGPKLKLNLSDSLRIIDGKCKSGSILDTIVKAVEDELCDSVGEVIDYITSNHVIPKTGELAEEKFAQHNIKYFIKQGKLEVEEEL